jgi:crotonobetainyl-CoA:carnitine CoA-transferase CaiB-like acyl-CoA transferase
MAFGALSSIRILDLTQMLAGPFGTMILADHGAEVIKVEPPSGDMTRAGGIYPKDDSQRTHNGYFQSVNRNKKSIVLNLKSEEGKAALLELVKSADAVMENFRVGVMDKLGLGYEELRRVNPKIVYGCLNGFGDPRTGRSPYASWPAFDVVAQAMGGIMSITGPDPETPTKVGPGVGDLVPGVFLAFGVLAAIHKARETGEGQFVDVSMVDSILAICERTVYQHSVLGLNPGPEGNHHPFLSPFGIYPAKDGHVTLAAPKDEFFVTLCERLGIPEIGLDARFSNHGLRGRNRAELIPILSEATATFTKNELTEMLGDVIPFGPLLQIEEMMEDEHFSVREMLPELEQPGSSKPIRVAGVPVKMTGTPGGVHRRGPYLGEDTEAILREAGLGDEAIAQLVEKVPALKAEKENA